MTIYEHRATVTTAGGSTSSTTLKVRGGLLRQLLVRALTSNATVFMVNLTDENSIVRRNYDQHEGELNDMTLALPVAGSYTINITNTSPNDTFSVVAAVQE